MSIIIKDRSEKAYQALYGKEDTNFESRSEVKWCENKTSQVIEREIESEVTVKKINRNTSIKSLSIGAVTGASFIGQANVIVSGSYQKETEQTQAVTETIREKLKVSIAPNSQGTYHLEIYDKPVKRELVFKLALTGFLPVRLRKHSYTTKSTYEFIELLDIFNNSNSSELTAFKKAGYVEIHCDRVLLKIVKEEYDIQRNSQVICSENITAPTVEEDTASQPLRSAFSMIAHEEVNGDLKQRYANPTYKNVPQSDHHATIDMVHDHTETLMKKVMKSGGAHMEAKKKVEGDMTQEFGNETIEFNESSSSVTATTAEVGFFPSPVFSNRFFIRNTETFIEETEGNADYSHDQDIQSVLKELKVLIAKCRDKLQAVDKSERDAIRDKVKEINGYKDLIDKKSEKKTVVSVVS